MKKATIYTRSGDSGTTALVSGTRVKKSLDRISLYGEVDELNSFIGLAVSYLDDSFDKVFLSKIQSGLFDLGSNFACEKEKRDNYKLPKIEASFITEIELEIDKMDELLPSLSSFILPGGTNAAATFHVCRTVCRRLERSIVDFQDKLPNEVSDLDLKFINRLSDYFFIMSRFLNMKAGKTEINWIAS
jgi:cob(I)alamin adenosyltransferase